MAIRNRSRKWPASKYYISMFFDPVLKQMSPRWYRVRRLSGAAASVTAIMGAVAIIIGSRYVIPLGVGFIGSIALFVISKAKLAPHVGQALQITEQLSKRWFAQQNDAEGRELSAKQAAERNLLHTYRGPLEPGGGTMYGSRGED